MTNTQPQRLANPRRTTLASIRSHEELRERESARRAGQTMEILDEQAGRQAS
ncbi:MAG: hypothetical protein JWL64_2728 [Frankiales bacterium]|nr:hypothetical protein [Frankiales bacterium]